MTPEKNIVACGGEKARLAARIESRSAALVELCRTLVRIDSTNPPGDTSAIVEAVESVLHATPGTEHRRVVGRAPAVNLVPRMRGVGPGRRLALNGHLDTFPIGKARWSYPPLGTDLEDGRIYGRGACDMKAGVAALVLALVGDDETGGRRCWERFPCPYAPGTHSASCWSRLSTIC